MEKKNYTTPFSNDADSKVSLDQIMRDYSAEYVPETKTWTSSLIKETSYNALKYELTITFSNDQQYLYKEFLPESYQNFCNAESQGKYFLTEMRKQYADNQLVIKLEKDE
jgi:hypothetical protein